jgi:hypothetical protein
MVKAIARAFRWREMLENGTHATIAEIAAAEKINESYVGRVLRLTLLAPDIVETILGGRHPTQMTLAVLMRRLPILWSAQRAELMCPTRNRNERPCRRLFVSEIAPPSGFTFNEFLIAGDAPVPMWLVEDVPAGAVATKMLCQKWKTETTRIMLLPSSDRRCRLE